MLWVDRYAPCPELKRLELHQPLNRKLLQLAKSPALPNLLFYGPPGAGKRIRIRALLQSIYGPEALRFQQKPVKCQSGKEHVDIDVLSSKYHYEITPADVGSKDRIVIQSFFKEIAESMSLLKMNFKVLVLHDVDQMTATGQAALRRTMETTMHRCRMILCCEQINRVLPALQSRCFIVSVPAPTTLEIARIVQTVANHELMKSRSFEYQHVVVHNKKDDGDALDDNIVALAQASKRHLRRALIMLQHCFNSFKRSDVNNRVQIKPMQFSLDWETMLESLAQRLIQEQSPKTLLEARDILRNLLDSTLPPQLILKTLAQFLAATFPEAFCIAAFYVTHISSPDSPNFNFFS
jgi:replication factor C subunit 3/5